MLDVLDGLPSIKAPKSLSIFCRSAPNKPAYLVPLPHFYTYTLNSRYNIPSHAITMKSRGDRYGFRILC